MSKNIDNDKVIEVANYSISNMTPDMQEDLDYLINRMKEVNQEKPEGYELAGIERKIIFANLVLEDAIAEGCLEGFEAGTTRIIEMARVLNERLHDYDSASSADYDPSLIDITEKENRLLQLESMVKAGIPRRIANYWVSGIIKKNTMFHALNLFGDGLEKVEDIVAKCLLDRGLQFSEDYPTSKLRLDFIHELYNDYPISLLTYSSAERLNLSELEFLKECYNSTELQNLYLNIVENDFDFSLAQKCIKDYGFDKYPNAMDEVVQGANWEAVAAKHGFLQY